MLRILNIWRFARNDVRLLCFALRHRSRPAWLSPITVILAWYALEPANFALPALGLVDDFVLLPLLLHLLVKALPADIRAGYQRFSLER